MATLALAREFLSGYSKLDHAVQKRVQELAEKCRQMSLVELSRHKGTHLETHTGQKDPRARTVRLGDNHRGIALVPDGGDQVVLVDVLPHQEADRWMANNEFKVNAATGALEVVNAAAIAGEREQIAEPASPTSPLLFEHRRDRDFVALGVSEDLVPTLRLLHDDDQLAGLVGVLPEGQAEALIALTGDESVESIYAQVAGSIRPDDIDTADVAAAVTAPASRGRFHVVSDEDELAEMLAQPLAQWRTYLHHTQHDIAYRPSYNGAVRVTGGAGTGKTVVAIHRTKALAERLERRDGTPILFTTFTRNLAQSIEADLRSLGGVDLLDVVDVVNVDRLAHRIVTEIEGSSPRTVDDRALGQLCDELVLTAGLEDAFSGAFVRQEWEQVVLAQDLSSRDDYFNASRAGRGRRLDRRDRAKVWRVIEALTQELTRRGRRTHLQIAAVAAGHLAQESVRPYQHVVVDEAQDLHEAQWRLLRAAVAEGPDDLFIVGDAHQRIYDRRSSLSKVGINVRGRSKKLRINYRTTHEILRWSLGVLGATSFDDLDEGTDDHDVAGYHSFVHGPEPTVAGFASASAMLDGLVAQLRSWTEQGIEPAAIGVTARSASCLDAVETAVGAAGVPTHRLTADLRTGDGVALGTMHRFKGLEFRVVAVVDADDETIPSRWAVTDQRDDPVQHEHDLQRERCVLYVACTRARDDLWVAWSGTPSRFLPRPR